MPFLHANHVEYAVSVSFADGAILSAAFEDFVSTASEFSVRRALGESHEAPIGEMNSLREMLVSTMTRDLSDALGRIAKLVRDKLGIVGDQRGFPDVLLRRVLSTQIDIDEQRLLRLYREAQAEAIIAT